MADDRRLPGINHESAFGREDLTYEESVTADEFRTRTQVISGSYRSTGASYGIVTGSDPRDDIDLISAPLRVKRNDTNPLAFDVESGTAITQCGDFIRLSSAQTNIEPTETLSAGDQFVVYLEYETVENEDTAVLNRFNVNQAIRRERPSAEDIVQVATLTDWNDLTIFTPDRMQHIVPLALLSGISDDTGLRLEVGLDDSVLPGNRPWFSPVDIEHRSLVGTGSDDTPHNLSLSDLSSGDLTLYKQDLNHGVVLSRDVGFPSVPGKICTEVIDAVRERIDIDGTVTGTFGIKYFELTRFPVRLLGVAAVNDPTREIAAHVIPHTNLLVIHGNESVGATGSTVYYTTADAGEPNIRADANDELVFRQPTANTELVVTGGRALTEIQPQFTDNFGNSRAKIALGDSGPIPKKFQIMVDEEGQLFASPQLLLCGETVNNLGTLAYEITRSQVGDAKIRLGLTNTPNNTSMNLTVRVSGTGPNGSLEEDLTFTTSNYSPALSGACEESPGNFVVSEGTFSSVDTIQVITSTSIDPNAIVVLYADVNPLITSELEDACPLAEINWNGQSVCRVRDVRRVGSRLGMPSRTNVGKLIGQAILASTMTELTSVGREIASDDLRDPHTASITQGIRFNKFSDGLRSTTLPADPRLESLLSTEEDIFYTQAFVLPERSDRKLQVVLLGNDTDNQFVQANDGIIPTVEYRIGQQNANPWSTWVQMTPSVQGDKHSFFATIPDDFPTNFKIQFRFKGQIAAYAALLRPTLSTLEQTNEYTATQTVRTVDLGEVSGDIDLNLELSNTFAMTVTGATTINVPTGLKDGGTYILRISQDGAGGNTVTFASGWQISSNLQPLIISTAADAEDIISFVSDGTDVKIVGVAQNIVTI